MAHRGSIRAKETIYDILERQDRVNRDHGKVEFRIKVATLAAKSRYSRTTVKSALAALHSEGRIDWRRTGRSSLFRLPLSTHPVRQRTQAPSCPSDGQKASIRKSESDHRNKALLKNCLEEGGITKSTGQRPAPGFTEADNLVMDFASATDSHVRFDVAKYASRYGVSHLADELNRLRRRNDCRNLVLTVDEATGEVCGDYFH